MGNHNGTYFILKISYFNMSHNPDTILVGHTVHSDIVFIAPPTLALESTNPKSRRYIIFFQLQVFSIIFFQLQPLFWSAWHLVCEYVFSHHRTMKLKSRHERRSTISFSSGQWWWWWWCLEFELNSPWNMEMTTSRTTPFSWPLVWHQIWMVSYYSGNLYCDKSFSNQIMARVGSRWQLYWCE